MARLQSFSRGDVTQLVEMTAESLNLDRNADYSVRTGYLEDMVIDFENAVAAVLVEFDPSGKALEESDWALDVLHTLNGEGAGIWDGRWDHIYSEEQIKTLKKLLKSRLGRWADDTGGGKLNVALMDEAEQLGYNPDEDDEDEDDDE
jgi:hypothetical protein